MAREKVEKVRESAVHSSWFAPALGAGVGALVAKALQSRAQAREDHRFGRDEYWYGRRGEEDWYGPSGPEYRGRAAGSKERTGAKLEELKERTGEVKEQVSAKAGEIKDRVSEQVSSLRERMPDRERIRASTHEDTGLWALGAAALGFLFGFALPVSQKERELLEPAKRKARELGEQAKELAVQKGSQALDQASQKLESTQTGNSGEPNPQPQQSEQGEAQSPPALH